MLLNVDCLHQVGSMEDSLDLEIIFFKTDALHCGIIAHKTLIIAMEF